jgi:hypothetical protein
MLIDEKIQRERLRTHRELQRAELRKHFDANDTMFLERELIQLRARMYEVQFPTLIARTLMPFANDVAASADTYGYKVLRPIGAAKIVATNAKDLPRVDVAAREVLGKVHQIGLAYGWDINQLREAARLQIPLSDIKAKTARDASERGIDEILATGDLEKSAAQNGLELNGLLNNPDVEAQGIRVGSWWFATTPPTPSAVLAELGGILSAISADSDDRWAADTLLLPTKLYNYASQTPFSTLTGDSILTIFKKNNESLKLIRPWYRCNTAGAGGVPRAVAYQRDSTVLEGVVPQEFEQFPPQASGLEFVVPCTARCGGVKIYQPTAVRYIDFAVS